MDYSINAPYHTCNEVVYTVPANNTNIKDNVELTLADVCKDRMAFFLDLPARKTVIRLPKIWFVYSAIKVSNFSSFAKRWKTFRNPGRSKLKIGGICILSLVLTTRISTPVSMTEQHSVGLCNWDGVHVSQGSTQYIVWVIRFLAFVNWQVMLYISDFLPTKYLWQGSLPTSLVYISMWDNRYSLTDIVRVFGRTIVSIFVVSSSVICKSSQQKLLHHWACQGIFLVLSIL